MIKRFGEIVVVLRNRRPVASGALEANVLKDFVVERILGEGGMGTVYLVRKPVFSHAICRQTNEGA